MKSPRETSVDVAKLVEQCLDQIEERGMRRDPPWLNTQQCAERLGVHPITLIRWRKASPPRGPRAYVAPDSRIVRYRTSEVDAYLLTPTSAEGVDHD
jgi:hypothetical protein